MRRGWHIDGCPSDFVKGMTDHYGTIHNFDCLVGVLLSDVPEPMSGELVVYPGSHAELAAHFKTHPSLLGKLRHEGASHLPTGEQTDRLFRREAVHCTGFPPNQEAFPRSLGCAEKIGQKVRWSVGAA